MRPLLVIPPAIHSFYFFDPNGIRLEISSDLDGDEEDLQVIRSCSMSETELRAELETISTDKAWIDDMVVSAVGGYAQIKAADEKSRVKAGPTSYSAE